MEHLDESLINMTYSLCDFGIQNETIICIQENNTQPPATLQSSQGFYWTVRIVLYSLIFLLSIVGNALIIAVLVRNRRMRTVTNIFLLSLAVSDLMLCLFCMPLNLIPNLMQDFRFGSSVCKLATYFMGISVSVSTFSLVAISLERYSAICNPLKSRAWQTKSHALKVISATWVVSFIIMLPYPISSSLVPFNRSNNSTGNMCRLTWPSDVIHQSWSIFLLLILFLIPGFVMMTAYGLISLELYRGIKFEMSLRRSSRERKFSTSSFKQHDGDGCYLQKPKKKKMEMQTVTTTSSSLKINRVRSNSSTANLMAKKRVIRMLIVIVILFFICWTPLFSANAWKAFDRNSAGRLLSGAPISFIQLLSYTSACVNPIIYCFMNKRFRMGFLATFTCCKKGHALSRDVDDEGGNTGASLSSRLTQSQKC